jgi:hypothetical protein
MILPTKHIDILDSLIGVGSILLHKLTQEYTVSSLWDEVRHNEHVATYERYILTLDLLYLLGLIELRNGKLIRTAH